MTIKNNKKATIKGSAKKKETPPASEVVKRKTRAVQKVSPAKKTPPRKSATPAPKTVSVKKASAPAKIMKKGAPRTAAATKELIKQTLKNLVKPTPKKTKAPPKAPVKTVAKPIASAIPKKPRFSERDLEQFKVELLAMRNRITGQSGSMRNDALQRTDEVNPEEDGTDAFMRLQTLEQVSSQQQIIANIDEALRAIEKGAYGICDMCGELINKPRLSVLPFAKNCIKCQSEMERASRPFGRR